jgi:acyl-CoA thioester hydrolase
MNAPPPHIFTGRVFLEDTDALGIVYHARYLQFAERARHEWLRKIGYSHQNILSQYQISLVVRSCHIRFLQPLTFDQTFAVNTQLISSSAYTFSLLQNIHLSSQNQDTAHPVLEKKSAKIQVEIACVNNQKTLCKPPENLLQVLSDPTKK